jgi:hypothetical protein
MQHIIQNGREVNGHKVNPPLAATITVPAAPVVQPKVVELSKLLKAGVSVAVRAVHAANTLEGKTAVVVDAWLVAKLYEVSVTSMNNARRLSNEERNAVLDEKRPLVLPRAASPQERLSQIVDEIGLDRVRNLLWAFAVTNAG